MDYFHTSRFLFLMLAFLFVLNSQGQLRNKHRRVVAFFQHSCATWPGKSNPCQQFCIDIEDGGFYCACREGFNLNDDGMTCSGPLEVKASNVFTVNPQYSDNLSKPQKETIRLSEKFNKNGELVIKDSDFLNSERIDLTEEADRGNNPAKLTQSRLVLERQMYNIPEGGYHGKESFDKLHFNKVPDNEELSGNQPRTSHGFPQRGSASANKDSGNSDLFKESLLNNEVEQPRERLSRPSQFKCEDIVCRNNGSCVERIGRVFCDCPLGTAGEKCEKLIEVRYPKFTGNSYLALPVLRSAHQEFSVMLEFKPRTDNGLLLFSAEEEDANKDFFSITMSQGKVVFRFDCGTGVAELKTFNKVVLNEWNTVQLFRFDNIGSLQLNDGARVDGISQGDYTRITFRLNLFLGGYPDMEKIATRVDTTLTFDGCVQQMVVNGHQYDFRIKGLVGEAEHGRNVGECSEGVCDAVTCQHGGSCVAKSADQHVCLCTFGYHGSKCERDSLIHVPHFSGHSFIEFPGLKRSVLSFTEIELVFKPTSADGTLLYNGFSRDRKGDFISLALRDGFLEFRFDLGTGPAVIRSFEPLALDHWHVIRASRTGLMGTLDIDGQQQTSGQSEGAYTQLTLLDGLFIGGHPNFDHTSGRANLTKSFSGCLQKLVINKVLIDLLEDNIRGVNVEPCSHPCTGSPCMNGGECKPIKDTYRCYCPIGYSNTNCEDEQSKIPSKPMFSGESFLIYKDKAITQRVSGNKLDLQLYIRPKSRSGLIFWSSETFTSKSKDFFSLGFIDGSLQLRYNLGSGEALIAYNDSRMFDGNWHFVRVQRDKQDSYMEIDAKEIVEGSSPGAYISLNTNKIVYLGGLPDIFEKTGGRFSSGFTGCIRSMKLATDYDVDLLAQAHSGRNIMQCMRRMFV